MRTFPEHGEKPVDMPTMVYGGIVGIQLCPTMAWRYDCMPPFRKMAIHKSFEKATYRFIGLGAGFNVR